MSSAIKAEFQNLAFHRPCRLRGDPGEPITASILAMQVRPRRHLHLQQRVEASALQFPAQRAHAGETGLLVVDEEFDSWQSLQQLLLALADHPGQRDSGPSLAQGADQRQDMGHVAQRGQAQQADRLGDIQNIFFTCS